jgi:hypothetical protein
MLQNFKEFVNEEFDYDRFNKSKTINNKNIKLDINDVDMIHVYLTSYRGRIDYSSFYTFDFYLKGNLHINLKYIKDINNVFDLNIPENIGGYEKFKTEILKINKNIKVENDAFDVD